MMKEESNATTGRLLPKLWWLILCISFFAAEAAPFRIAAFGDSLMAGYELNEGEGFVPQLQKKLVADGVDVEVIDFAISGNTSADGLIRVGQIIDAKPDGVLLGLGANDGLRFINPAAMQSNLDKIIQQFKANQIPLLLVGMESSLNWGPNYKKQYDQVFPTLAKNHDLSLYPFLLAGVALDPDLNLDDGLHPNPAGVLKIVEQMAPLVTEFIQQNSN